MEEFGFGQRTGSLSCLKAIAVFPISCVVLFIPLLPLLYIIYSEWASPYAQVHTECTKMCKKKYYLEIYLWLTRLPEGSSLTCQKEAKCDYSSLTQL